MHILSRKLQIEDVWDAYNKDQNLTERFKNTFKCWWCVSGTLRFSAEKLSNSQVQLLLTIQ